MRHLQMETTLAVLGDGGRYPNEMTPNPYEATPHPTTLEPTLRSVRGMLLWSAFFAMSAYQPIAYGLQLLGEKLGLFSIPYAVYDIEINGVAVSNRAFSGSILLSGALLVSISLVLALRARRNYKYNASVRLARAAQGDG